MNNTLLLLLLFGGGISPVAFVWSFINDLANITFDIAYGNGNIVIGSNNGNVLTSTDGGSNFTSYLADSTHGSNISQVKFGNGKFVALGNSTLNYSNDGITWNVGQITAHTTRTIMFDDFQNKFYCITSLASEVRTSSDGISWTILTNFPNLWSLWRCDTNLIGIKQKVDNTMDVYRSIDNGANWTGPHNMGYTGGSSTQDVETGVVYSDGEIRIIISYGSGLRIYTMNNDNTFTVYQSALFGTPNYRAITCVSGNFIVGLTSGFDGYIYRYSATSNNFYLDENTGSGNPIGATFNGTNKFLTISDSGYIYQSNTVNFS